MLYDINNCNSAMSNFQYSNILTPSPSSNDDSPSPQYIQLDERENYGTEMNPIFYIEQNEIVTPIPMNTNQQPYLAFLEQPIDKFRFRYKSEMTGTHGSLNGMNSEKKKHSAPTVELCNYNKPAIIRCSIFQDSANEKHMPHAHRLVRKDGKDEKDDPHDVEVSPQAGKIRFAFHNMGIIHTAKKFVKPELLKKLTNLKKEEIAMQEKRIRELTQEEMIEIDRLAESESKSINLNKVRLRFDAFQKINGILYPLCKPVYSHAINNLKSALTGELKIVRMDHCSSPCNGGREIFLLVERVTKKNIKVRFFELDDDDNEVWHAYGKFSDLDVHHQYAIVFKTPPYRNLDITKPVHVYIQLERPSDEATSAPRQFQYIPCQTTYQPGLKRARNCYNTSNSYDSSEFRRSNSSTQSNNIPQMVQDVSTTTATNLEAELNSGNLETLARALDSDEYNEYFGTYLNDPEFNLAHLDEKSHPQYQFEYAQAQMANDVVLPNFDKLNLVPHGNIPLPYDEPQMGLPTYAQPLQSSFSIDAPNKKFKTSMIKPKRMYSPKDFKELEHAKFVLNQIENLIKTKPKEDRVISMLNHYFGEKNKTNALHTFLKQNDSQSVLSIIHWIYLWKQEHLLNIQDEYKNTCLHLAAKRNMKNIVLSLLMNNADPTVVDSNLNTPLHTALETNPDIEIIKHLVQCKGRQEIIEKENDDGDTPLYLAIKNNIIDAVKLLLDEGVDINKAHKKNGFTPLRMAVEWKRSNIVKLLLQNPNIDAYKKDYNDADAIIAAIEDQELRKIFTDNIKPPPDFEELEIKCEQMDEDISEEEEIEEKFAVKLEKISPEELREMYKSVTTFTPSCLDQIATILDRTNKFNILADLLDLGHLVRSGLCETAQSPTKVLLKLALESNGDTVLSIRDHLEALNEHEVVEIIDNMVKAMSI